MIRIIIILFSLFFTLTAYSQDVCCDSTSTYIRNMFISVDAQPYSFTYMVNGEVVDVQTGFAGEYSWQINKEGDYRFDIIDANGEACYHATNACLTKLPDDTCCYLYEIGGVYTANIDGVVDVYECESVPLCEPLACELLITCNIKISDVLGADVFFDGVNVSSQATYLWSTGETTEDINYDTPLCPNTQTYSVTVSYNGCDCTATESIECINCNDEITVDTINTELCVQIDADGRSGFDSSIDISPNVPPSSSSNIYTCWNISDLTPGTTYTFNIVTNEGCTYTETWTYIDPCSDPNIGMTAYFINGGGGLGVTGGTGPYLFEIEQVSDCFENNNGLVYARITVTDANDCQCVMHFITDADADDSNNECNGYTSLTDILNYYAEVQDLSTFGSFPIYSTTNPLVSDNGVYPSSPELVSFEWFSDCATAPEECPNIIIEFGPGNEFNPNTMIITFSPDASYPINWTITQITGVNSGQTYSGTATSSGSLIEPVIPSTDSNGQWTVTATDANGCVDFASGNVTQHG